MGGAPLVHDETRFTSGGGSSSPPPPSLAIEDRLINIFSDKRQPVRLIYRGGNGWSWRIDRGVNQTECKNADGNAWAVEIA